MRRRAIAGSFGPFCAVGLVRAAAILGDNGEASGEDWSAAFSAAVDVRQAERLPLQKLRQALRGSALAIAAMPTCL